MINIPHKNINKLFNNVEFKIFDKTFKKSNGIYGLYRFEDHHSLQMVKNNYNAILQDMKVKTMIVLKQCHGNQIVDIDNVQNTQDINTLELEGDGVLTTHPNILLTVQSADCVPVLLASAEKQVIGAAHCGWKSAKANILKNLVDNMREKGAGAIKAIIGPCINQDNYEVDNIFYKNILEEDSIFETLFKASWRDSHYYFDLKEYIMLKLKELKVFDILDKGEDTFSNPEKYWSYRRDVKLGITESKTNILSTIMIK